MIIIGCLLIVAILYMLFGHKNSKAQTTEEKILSRAKDPHDMYYR